MSVPTCPSIVFGVTVCHGDTCVLVKSWDSLAPESLETYFIKKNGHACISVDSGLIHNNEYQFLDSRY